MLVQVREQSLLRAIGLDAGASRYAHRSENGLGRGSGRIFAELQGALGLGHGVVVGLGTGPVVEIDPVMAPRWGAQATLWAFVGVIPFVRVGIVQKNGTYIDFGIKVALPVLRI